MRPRVNAHDDLLAGNPLALVRYGKKAKRKARATTKEATTQDLVEQYCDLVRVERFHIPEFLLANAFGRRAMSGPELGAAREASEEIKGFPDLALFYHGRFLAIELKTEIGKMSPSQLDWQRRLGTVQCRSFEAAKAEIDAWKRNVERWGA